LIAHITFNRSSYLFQSIKFSGEGRHEAKEEKDPPNEAVAPPAAQCSKETYVDKMVQQPEGLTTSDPASQLATLPLSRVIIMADLLLEAP